MRALAAAGSWGLAAYLAALATAAAIWFLAPGPARPGVGLAIVWLAAP